MTNILILTIVLVTGVQLYFWLGCFYRLRLASNKPAAEDGPGVSVVICARNEAENLLQNLHLVLSQKYSSFEVIVVDDHSVDQTSRVLRDLEKSYPHLVTTTNNGQQGKRQALQKGVDTASHDVIVFTDADCSPSSLSWLGSMVSPLSNGYNLVVGRAPFYREPGLLNAFARFENHLTLFQYGSAVLLGIPFMGVGRNMAMKKSIWDAYIPNPDHRGGDDDLLVNQLGSYHHMWVVTDPGASMYSQSESTWKDWLRQKRRHVSVSPAYHRASQFLLLCYAITHWAHYAGIILLLAQGCFMWGLALYLLRVPGVFICFHSLTNKQDRLKRIEILLSDGLFILYYPIVMIFLLLKPPHRW